MIATHDIHQRPDLAFPKSLPQFQKLFPDDAAGATLSIYGVQSIKSLPG
jgi:hypothetical protein